VTDDVTDADDDDVVVHVIALLNVPTHAPLLHVTVPVLAPQYPGARTGAQEYPLGFPAHADVWYPTCTYAFVHDGGGAEPAH
jgi:hypothetical protein